MNGSSAPEPQHHVAAFMDGWKPERFHNRAMPSSLRVSSFSRLPSLARPSCQVFGSSPDETAYFRMVLNRETVLNCLVMIQVRGTASTALLQAQMLGARQCAVGSAPTGG